MNFNDSGGGFFVLHMNGVIEQEMIEILRSAYFILLVKLCGCPGRAAAPFDILSQVSVVAMQARNESWSDRIVVSLASLRLAVSSLERS